MDTWVDVLKKLYNGHSDSEVLMVGARQAGCSSSADTSFPKIQDY